MTRKDYKKIAAVLGDVISEFDANGTSRREFWAVARVADSLADLLGIDNPAFDEGKFWEAIEDSRREVLGLPAREKGRAVVVGEEAMFSLTL